MKANLPQAWLDFYAQMWGERWAALYQSLSEAERQVHRKNLFSQGAVPGQAAPENPNYFEFQDTAEPPGRGPEGLLSYYTMDPASATLAQVLPIKAGDEVLDMCAAPGGKSLVLVEKLLGAGDLSGRITLNEFSAARRERLTSVVQNYVPRNVRDSVFVTGRDGGLFARTSPEHFDAILVDAPCSGERHFLERPSSWSEWTLRSSEKLAQRQYALMMSAVHALKPGGTILYSTCSISKLENEGVIARVLEKVNKKNPDSLRVSQEGPAGAEASGTYGFYYLPDRTQGLGPLYACLLLKTP